MNAIAIRPPKLPSFQARPLLGPADLEMAMIVTFLTVAEMQRVTEEHARAFRHGLHVEQMPVAPEWRDPKPLRDAWQRAADKQAFQISAPLDQVLEMNRRTRKQREDRARRPTRRVTNG